MNILAHLHLATLANSSIIGNVAADFVKGDPYQQFPQVIADGIMLHRRLDKQVDQMTEVKQARSLFLPTHQRVAPITLDIVWDHFLAKHWHHFNPDCDLVIFNQRMKSEINHQIQLFSPDCQQFMQHVWQGEWLMNYANLDFISKVLNGMANRRPKLFLIRDTVVDIHQNYSQLETHFFQFYPVLISQAQAKRL